MFESIFIAASQIDLNFLSLSQFSVLTDFAGTLAIACGGFIDALINAQPLAFCIQKMQPIIADGGFTVIQQGPNTYLFLRAGAIVASITAASLYAAIKIFSKRENDGE